MQDDRRRVARVRTELFINKFIDGYAHLARVVDISAHGCLVERVFEPAVERDLYPLEVALPDALGGTRMWLWARPVWSDAGRVALRFVGLDPVDRATLARFADALS